MMISPEHYYEEYLRGKTKEQIMSAIRSLKQAMGHLKNTMENPKPVQEKYILPSPNTRLHCTRIYLDRAKQAYIEAGGIYTPSKSEVKSAEFDSNMDFISKITFSIGGFFGGFRVYVAELTDHLFAYAYTNPWDDEEQLIPVDEDDTPVTKETFIAALLNLHIGEWRRNYSTERFGYSVLDGTQWELVFEYNNGQKPVSFSGSNAYPYNFKQFTELFGINDAEDE